MNVAHAHRPKETGPFEEIHEYRGVEKRKLKLAMTITGTVMVVEIVGGLLTNSLALLSDAGHMFTHLFALTVSFAAIVFASRAPSHQRTFGLYRVEILAALFNSLFLFAVTFVILYAGIERLLNPRPVLGLQMLAVAVVGLLVNLASVLILHGSSHDDLNVKGGVPARARGHRFLGRHHHRGRGLVRHRLGLHRSPAGYRDIRAHLRLGVRPVPGGRGNSPGVHAEGPQH